MIIEVADIRVRPGAGPEFGDWRAAIGGYFASDPLVEHFTVVAAPR
ncbi:MAG: hypothetical protein M0Z62_08480 [Actinomycetota bacterium]|jgi:hypothetical protein|nr:hypothetical protein [Actinomycetota bacterium]